jgi:hypothetical protein
MSVGFGFSVGDFLAGIQLVRDIISSLQASGGSTASYQGLAFTLFSLESALLEVKTLDFGDQHYQQINALKCAATQCQRTIDDFLLSIKRYQPSLTAQGSGSKIRDGIKKIQWAVCKKEDVAAFEARLRGHVSSINLLVTTVQLEMTQLHATKNNE